MVERLDDMRLDDLAQEFEVHDETGVGVWGSFDGYPELKVVAVPVLIAAFAEYLPVFFVGPFRAPKFVSCIEGFATRDVSCFHEKAELRCKVTKNVAFHEPIAVNFGEFDGYYLIDERSIIWGLYFDIVVGKPMQKALVFFLLK